MTMTTATTIYLKDKINGRTYIDVYFIIYEQDDVETAKHLLPIAYEIWLKASNECEETLSDFLSGSLNQKNIKHQMIVFIDRSELE